MLFKFRPHHFLCALSFEGKGYSPAFVRNFYRVLEALQANPDSVEIEVVDHLDDICQPCPNHQHQRCASENIIQQLDQAHAEILQIQKGDRLTWQSAKTKLKNQMSLEKFHVACAPCQWKKLGVCEAKLNDREMI